MIDPEPAERMNAAEVRSRASLRWVGVGVAVAFALGGLLATALLDAGAAVIAFSGVAATCYSVCIRCSYVGRKRAKFIALYFHAGFAHCFWVGMTGTLLRALAEKFGAPALGNGAVYFFLAAGFVFGGLVAWDSWRAAPALWIPATSLVAGVAASTVGRGTDSAMAVGAIALHAAIVLFMMQNANRHVRAELATAVGDACSKCGYDLRGITDRCPECGTALPQRTAS